MDMKKFFLWLIISVCLVSITNAASCDYDNIVINLDICPSFKCAFWTDLHDAYKYCISAHGDGDEALGRVNRVDHWHDPFIKSKYCDFDVNDQTSTDSCSNWKTLVEPVVHCTTCGQADCIPGASSLTSVYNMITDCSTTYPTSYQVCHNGACRNPEISQIYCEVPSGYTTGWAWLNNKCCGNTAGENTLSRKCASPYTCTSVTDKACCDETTDCVSAGECYNQGSKKVLLRDELICYNGIWSAPTTTICDNDGTCEPGYGESASTCAADCINQVSPDEDKEGCDNSNAVKVPSVGVAAGKTVADFAGKCGVDGISSCWFDGGDVFTDIARSELVYNPLCCGDDANEKWRYRQCGTDVCTSGTSDLGVACCSDATDCVWNKKCYTGTTGSEQSFEINNAMAGQEVCSQGHWCPYDFVWDTGTSKCIPQFDVCLTGNVVSNQLIVDTESGLSICKKPWFSNDWLNQVKTDATSLAPCYEYATDDFNNPIYARTACVYRTDYNNAVFGEYRPISVMSGIGCVSGC